MRRSSRGGGNWWLWRRALAMSPKCDIASLELVYTWRQRCLDSVMYFSSRGEYRKEFRLYFDIILRVHQGSVNLECREARVQSRHNYAVHNAKTGLGLKLTRPGLWWK